MNWMQRFNDAFVKRGIRFIPSAFRPALLARLLVVAALGSAPLLTGCAKKESVDPNVQIQKQGFYYTCSMHPQVREAKPGSCPICQMPLVKELIVHPGSVEQKQSTPHAPGTVMISSEKQQLIGMKTDTARREKLTRVIRATGTFEHDETRLAVIAPRFGGWIRELYVNSDGQDVGKGEALMKVYSPELLAAENEYLIAWRGFTGLARNAAPGDAAYGGARASAKKLLDAARRRLELWGIGEDEIHALEQTGHATDELTVRSPVAGHVTVKNALQGKAFNAGEALYEIADLSRLWVRVFVYEADLPFLKIGAPARVILPYRGNETIAGTISFLYPHIDATTRRAEARIVVDNPHHTLHPDMWATVEWDADMGEMLVVPASAVIDTGERYLAFVDRGEGMLEPRTLRVGKRTDDFYEVLDGVKEGEKVVTRALFLVDSESQLKSATAGMAGMPGMAHESGSGKPEAGESGNEGMPGMPGMTDHSSH